LNENKKLIKFGLLFRQYKIFILLRYVTMNEKKSSEHK